MFKEDDNRYRRAAEREIFTEVSCDYVLPDYLGEVRKILFTEARCLPLPTYINGEELSVSGTVAFRMIYNDAEGRLSSVEFTEDYENCERGTVASADVCAESEIAGFSMRLLGPRKISAKARVCSDVRMLSTESLDLSGSAAELPTLETAKRSVSVMTCFCGDATEREYAEPIAELDGVIADEVRVIYENCECVVSECRAASGEVWVSGENLVCALIAIGDSPAAIYRRSIPFAETLILPEAEADMSASVSALFPSLKIEVTPTDTGSSVCASLIAEYTPSVMGNRPLTLTTDAYLTDRDSECRYGELELYGFSENRRMSERAEILADAQALSLDSPESVLFLCADARVRDVELSHGVIKITADIRFSGIACENNGENTPTYAPIRYSTEYIREIAVEGDSSGELCPTVGVMACACEGRIEEGGILLCADVICDLSLSSRARYRYLSSIEATGEAQEKKCTGKITVYYPDAEDTLFTVARRFRTTAERVAIDNALTEAAVADGCAKASLSGVEMLIIK